MHKARHIMHRVAISFVVIGDHRILLCVPLACNGKKTGVLACHRALDRRHRGSKHAGVHSHMPPRHAHGCGREQACEAAEKTSTMSRAR